ncbi:MAG: hypothetical protein ACJ8FY_26400 [Gemmataceae bacterium]
MASSGVSEQQIVEALHGVPAERWSEVLRFLDALQVSSGPSAQSAIQTAKDLSQSGLVGIWADRQDIKDSQTFAMRLRKEAETRGGPANAAGH